MLKRRRTKKTDYKQRLALLRSNEIRLVIRRSLNNIHVQLVRFNKTDNVLLERMSRNLQHYGWKGHGGNISSAYLTGLLIGKEALEKKITKAIVDIGLQTSVPRNALFAAALGAKDAGMDISLDEKILPGKDRIEGSHTAKYAAMLKKDNEEAYKKQFSAYLKNGLDPEKLPEHFADVKKKIMENIGKVDKNG